jgi:acetylornithine/N-succinyldiaminopimelate aminotransferase
LIKGPFGCGTMLAFTFSNGAKDKTLQFAQSLFQAGVIGFIAGAEPTRVRFLIPAGGVTHADIDEAAKIIEQVLQKINAYP